MAESKSTAPRHGMYRTPEHSAWSNMIQRCTNPKTPRYSDWGGRGITVCDRWLASFLNFYEDMGPKPTPQHSIDRINNDGNYEPGNVRWATASEQTKNSRKARYLTYNGKTLCISDWASKIGIHKTTLSDRLSYGWSLEKALTTPKQR